MKGVATETSLGRVEGFEHPLGVAAFLGIPYAAPPVGPLRFRAPEPAAPWTGVRDCRQFGPSPMQSVSNALATAIPASPVGPVSEDCLTLNVWTPAPAGARPVMVWIYGGAFLTGTTCNRTYDGAALAAGHDAVVVSVNYRVGALGFFTPPGGDANCGLRDQMAAIRWVLENAPAFGGSPDNITVFGESAGAGSLLHLLANRHLDGVIRRAILQSPGVEHTQLPEHAARVLAEVMAAAGVDDAGQLWDLPAEGLLSAQEAAFGRLMGELGAMPFHPVVDGDFLGRKPGVDFTAPGIDLLVSWTAEELRLYPNPAMAEGDRLLRSTRAMITKRTGSDPGDGSVRDLIEFYRPAGDPADIWAALQTDCLMRLPARRIATDHAATSFEGVGTYAAQFDWGATGGPWRRGAFHAIDLPFTFGTLEQCGWAEFLGIEAADRRGAAALAKRHMAAWSAFARSGNPGWEPYPDRVMSFDEHSQVVGDPLAEAAAVWAGLWSADGPPP